MQLVPTRSQDVTAGHGEQFVRHRGPITCVTCVPNRDAAVTSGYDGAVAWVDLAARRVDLMGYHDHLVNRVSVNAEGSKAASASSDYSIFIWDLDSRTVERVLVGHSDDVEDFVFVDERTGVSVSRDTRVLVWDLETGAIARVIDGHDRDALSVAFGNGRIFSSGDDMTLRVWDLADGSLIRKWGPFEYETDSCAVDVSRNRAVLGCDDGKLRIFDVVTGERIAEIPAHTSGIKKVAISPANGDILSVAYDQRACVWRAEDLQATLSLQSHNGVWERSFNWSPDGSRLVAGTFDGTIVVWDAGSGVCLYEIGDAGRGNSCLNDVAATTTGDIVAVADDGVLRLGRMTQEEAMWVSEASPPAGRVLANAVAVDEERGLVVAGTHDHTVQLFELRGGALDPSTTLRLGEGPVNAVRVSQQATSKGQLFCACYSGAIVRVGRDNEILGAIRVHEGAVKSLCLHPAEPVGVSCSADGAVLAWDFDGRLLRQYPGHMAIVDDVDIAPDGRCLASVSRDFTAKVYNIADGRLLHSFALGHRSPKGVCFWSPDAIIVTNYWGAVIRIDLASGTMIERQIAQNGVSAISRCGEHVVVVSYDGSAHLLDPRTLDPVSSLQTMTQRLQPSRLF
jgi:WD40 repeat protein